MTNPDPTHDDRIDAAWAVVVAAPDDEAAFITLAGQGDATLATIYPFDDDSVAEYGIGGLLNVLAAAQRDDPGLFESAEVFAATIPASDVAYLLTRDGREAGTSLGPHPDHDPQLRAEVLAGLTAIANAVEQPKPQRPGAFPALQHLDSQARPATVPLPSPAVPGDDRHHR